MEYITQRKADISHPELIYDMIWWHNYQSNWFDV